MNKPITYIIADDAAIYLELTQQYLKLVPNLECIAACKSAVEANAVLQTQTPDLLILDIEMPELSGIQLAKSLRYSPLIIFISSHTHYAVDAFDVDAIDYLVKPITPERLIKAVEKARALINMKNTISAKEAFQPDGEEAFFIKDKTAFVKINYADVLYMESLGDFINIFLQQGEKKNCFGKFKKY
ncbi:MAG: response regulator [Ferruginibacter sp.]